MGEHSRFPIHKYVSYDHSKKEAPSSENAVVKEGINPFSCYIIRPFFILKL